MKYYTPEISEFHVGFEFQGFADNGWEDESIRDWRELYTVIDRYSHTAGFRVKTLDREDIESKGFAHVGSGWYKYRHGVMVEYWTDLKLRKWKGNQIIITGFRGDEEGVLFSGDIKNKSEFKRILKQLGI